MRCRVRQRPWKFVVQDRYRIQFWISFHNPHWVVPSVMKWIQTRFPRQKNEKREIPVNHSIDRLLCVYDLAPSPQYLFPRCNDLWHNCSPHLLYQISDCPDEIVDDTSPYVFHLDRNKTIFKHTIYKWWKSAAFKQSFILKMSVSSSVTLLDYGEFVNSDWGV